MVTVCVQCGDKGFSNSFVYCVMCLKFAVHRYCLDEVPKTFDEFVDWVCDDCEHGLRWTASSLKPEVTNFEERDHTNLNDLKNQRIIGDGNGRLRKPILPSRNKKRKRSLVAKEKFRSSLEQIDEVDEDAERSSSLSIKLKERESCALRAVNTDNGLQSAEKCAELQSQAPLKNASALTAVVHAKPFFDPVWRGGFLILDKDYDAFDGLGAHLSTTACSKAREEAELFPALLKLEMYPTVDIWPKSFKTSEPSDNIALYFFARDQRYGKLFDRLVRDMMNGKLALKSIVQNAELLIFTSHELPSDFQRFQGKFYLWGVFRAKKIQSSS